MGDSVGRYGLSLTWRTPEASNRCTNEPARGSPPATGWRSRSRTWVSDPGRYTPDSSLSLLDLGGWVAIRKGKARELAKNALPHKILRVAFAPESPDRNGLPLARQAMDAVVSTTGAPRVHNSKSSRREFRGTGAGDDMPSQDNAIATIRRQAPLVHNITNYVVMNTTANALLAIGASPIMAHAVEEVEDVVALSAALVVNIGTLSPPWVEAMFRAAEKARALGIPIVFDPVGCGATPYRTDTARRFVETVRPTAIRGNASEIRALAVGRGDTKGVDSRLASSAVLDDALALAATLSCVVSVSGVTDLIVGRGKVFRIANGHPMMSRVTGMGCTASALTGAFLAVLPDAVAAAVKAMLAMGVAGEEAGQRSAGPGSFKTHFLDALHDLTDADLMARGRITGEE